MQIGKCGIDTRCIIIPSRCLPYVTLDFWLVGSAVGLSGHGTDGEGAPRAVTVIIGAFGVQMENETNQGLPASRE